MRFYFILFLARLQFQKYLHTLNNMGKNAQQRKKAKQQAQQAQESQSQSEVSTSVASSAPTGTTMSTAGIPIHHGHSQSHHVNPAREMTQEELMQKALNMPQPFQSRFWQPQMPFQATPQQLTAELFFNFSMNRLNFYKNLAAVHKENTRDEKVPLNLDEVAADLPQQITLDQICQIEEVLCDENGNDRELSAFASTAETAATQEASEQKKEQPDADALEKKLVVKESLVQETKVVTATVQIPEEQSQVSAAAIEVKQDRVVEQVAQQAASSAPAEQPAAAEQPVTAEQPVAATEKPADTQAEDVVSVRDDMSEDDATDIKQKQTVLESTQDKLFNASSASTADNSQKLSSSGLLDHFSATQQQAQVEPFELKAIQEEEVVSQQRTEEAQKQISKVISPKQHHEAIEKLQVVEITCPAEAQLSLNEALVYQEILLKFKAQAEQDLFEACEGISQSEALLDQIQSLKTLHTVVA